MSLQKKLAHPYLKTGKSTNWKIDIEGKHSGFRGGVTGFSYEVEDLIAIMFQRSEGSGKSKRGIYHYRNIAEAIDKGFESEAGVRQIIDPNRQRY